MKKETGIALILSLLVLTGCSDIEPSEEEVGNGGEVINWLSFFPDTCYYAGGSLYAEGSVQNQGTETIAATWYVEAQFYSDSSYELKLGGNVDEILVPLEPGQSTIWRVEFNSNSVEESRYPNCAANDFRGVYK